tara:strand:- start:231 stop:911 length:681 start_codon:yes stop_codon:yes gene_type:complete
MKLITFCLWGDDPKYSVGALRNAELAPTIYPGWECRFYVANCAPPETIKELNKMPGVQVVEKKEEGNWSSMFWRFEAAGEEDVEVMISRDTDSRLNLREKAAVDEWMDSDKGFHAMRDHPWHGYPVLGGMWGAKKGTLPQMKEMINDFSGQDKYGTDYDFFAQVVAPLIKDNVMIHDEFFQGSRFPIERTSYEFVGQVFDEHEKTIESHVEILKKHLDDKRPMPSS